MPNENETTETTPAGDVAQVTPAEIVAPLGERMPPVTESANSAPVESPKSETTSPEVRDAKGVKFDPFRHQTMPNGEPRKNARGNFMIKNEYRLGKIRREGFTPQTPKSSRPAPNFASSSGGNSEQENSPVLDQFDTAAEVYLQAAYGPLQIAFGPDIRADETDHATLKAALANYLRSTGATELSPGWALAITVAAFAAKKASVPTVQERALTIWEKARAMFGKKAKPVS